MQEGDYELMPHQEILSLKKQVEEMQGGPSTKKLLSSMEDLKTTIGDLTELFRAATQEMQQEEKEEASVSRKLDKVLSNNKVIAEALLSLSDKVEKLHHDQSLMHQDVLQPSQPIPPPQPQMTPQPAVPQQQPVTPNAPPGAAPADPMAQQPVIDNPLSDPFGQPPSNAPVGEPNAPPPMGQEAPPVPQPPGAPQQAPNPPAAPPGGQPPGQSGFAPPEFSAPDFNKPMEAPPQSPSDPFAPPQQGSGAQGIDDLPNFSEDQPKKKGLFGGFGK